MVVNRNSRKLLDAALLRRGMPGFGKAPEPEAPVYSPTPMMERTDDLNRSILRASLAQAMDDFNIHRLMFEPVANVRRAREVQ